MSSKKGVLKKIRQSFKRKSETQLNHDVVFCIGPEKVLIKAVQSNLRTISPIFERELDGNWNVYLRRGEGIPLVDLNPKAFKLFTKLATSNTWNAETLKDLNLSPEKLLNLLKICTRFEIHPGKANLEELFQNYCLSCSKPEELEKLIGMSLTNFKTVVESDDFCIGETKVYKIACRWAANKCMEMDLKETTENLRKVLGSTLFEIRFPLMTNAEFTKCMEFKQLLTPDECLKIYKFIGLSDKKKKHFDGTKLAFRIKKRSLHLEQLLSIGISTLCLTNECNIVNDPPFICDGTRSRHLFATKERIELHGLGFLGPIDFDANYDVTVKIKRDDNIRWTLIAKQISSQIFARKGQIFHFLFDTPIILEASSLKLWMCFYTIDFYLKGPNTASVQRSWGKEKLIRHGVNEFRFKGGNQQLAQILFKKI